MGEASASHPIRILEARNHFLGLYPDFRSESEELMRDLPVEYPGDVHRRSEPEASLSQYQGKPWE